MPYALPPLPYPYDALEPHIDKMTMEIHHTRHHQTYVNNVNKALEQVPEALRNLPIEDLLRQIDRVPESLRTVVRNNGGGHANHSLFWVIMSPNGGGKPTGKLAEAVDRTFGSFDSFKDKLSTTAINHFGSGWGWLCVNGQGQLVVKSTPNQDSPYMEGLIPILGIDVWEHAYYLKYQNRRAEYVAAWWNVVNWPEVARRYEEALASIKK
jgi:Fe-Mn family superoxide dismutase